MKIIILAMLAASTAFGTQVREVAYDTEDGGRIVANLYGNGEHAVLLAHGAVFDKESWDPLAQRLASAGHAVLAIDFRGYGKSRAGSDGRALHHDVLAGVRYLRSAGAKSVSVIGASMGGGAAAGAATLANRGEIDQLVLLAGVSIRTVEQMKAGELVYIASRDEPSISAIRAQYERAPEPKRLELLDGDAHAQHIFNTDQAEALTELILSAVARASSAGASQQEWTQLFNGRDLSGWTPKITGYGLGDNFGDTFRVEDGLLKVVYDQYDSFDGRFGHLFFEESFSHYILRIEYRFVGEQAPNAPGWAFRNSGVMIHGEPPEAMGKDQDFPASIEVQFLGGGGTGERTTANLCTPGTNVVMEGELITRHCTNSTSKTYHGDQWVTVEVEVRGDETIKHIIDGETVLEYGQPQLDEREEHARELVARAGTKMLSGGSISLQSEGHPIEFRKVELRRLR